MPSSFCADRRVNGFRDVAEGLLDDLHLLLEPWMRYVDHVQQQVSFANLVEGRFEGLDELRREFADEAHRIGDQERQVVENYFPDRCVERCKEFVFGKYIALAQQVHQCRFADIGISDQRYSDQLSAIASLDGHLTVDLLEILLQFCDTVTDNSAVGFDLAFTGTATGSGTTSLPLEVSPHTGQSGQHVFELSQLDLSLGIGCLCAGTEDIEDQSCTVEDPAWQLFFDVPSLRR